MDLTKIDERIQALRARSNESAKRALSGLRGFFTFAPFSIKQKQLLTWWMPTSPVKDKDGIIADGAIRSGKTLAMSLSFVIWAMATFSGQNLAMCGKTIGSFRRNVLFWLKLMLRSRGYRIEDRRTDNLVIVSRGSITNYFYLFGGKDERSQDLIQGITLAGVLFDEVALMPESFVNQATGRCSVDGSKFWFNCNPQGPKHWFKAGWIDQRKVKRLLYLHFTMDDNLSLSDSIKARYKAMYSGVFFQRYILGLWVLAEGVIYSMFDEVRDLFTSWLADDRRQVKYYVASDYGITNPQVFLLFAVQKDEKGIEHAWLLKEYYNERKDQTDLDYLRDYEEFIKGYPIEFCIIDPSATSLINLLVSHKHRVRKASNEVLEGISNVTTWMNERRLHIHVSCRNTVKEMVSYVWDDKATEKGKDQPLKTNDHAMDALRYFINTLFNPRQKWMV